MQPNGEREILGNNLRNEGCRLQFFHKMIIVHIIYFVVKLLNEVPVRLGILKQHTPAEIVLGWKLDTKRTRW